MKKILLSAIVLIIFSTPMYAFNAMLGAKAGYFVWRPFYKDINAGIFQNIENGDGVLYGPVLSLVPSDDLSFSLAGLFGDQKADWSQDREWDDEENKYISGNYTLNVERIDIDSALSYRIHSNIKIFGGYKYQSTKSEIRLVEHKSSTLDDSDIYAHIEKENIEAKNHGPALGIGYSLPIKNKYFFTTNLSFLYMFGRFKGDLFTYHHEGDGWNQDDYRGGEIFDLKGRSMGINFEPSIGAAVDENIIITLGGRYQWMRTKVLDPPDHLEGAADDAMNDHLFGIFVSVLYIF